MIYRYRFTDRMRGIRIALYADSRHEAVEQITAMLGAIGGGHGVVRQYAPTNGVMQRTLFGKWTLCENCDRLVSVRPEK